MSYKLRALQYVEHEIYMTSRIIPPIRLSLPVFELKLKFKNERDHIARVLERVCESSFTSLKL